MRRSLIIVTISLAATASLGRAQGPSSPKILPPEQQIAGAVLPLPKEMRDGAAVLGYSPAGQLVKLREGKNDMICLASDPKADGFHTACYHKSLEPFMARGRELRAQGVKDAEVDTVRFREIAAGKLKMPTQAASLYQIFGKAGSFDPATGEAKDARALFVVYLPFATAASTGLSPAPQRNGPWIMFPGTPKAHIMFTFGM